MEILTGRIAVLKSFIVLAAAGLFGILVISGGGNRAAASAFGPSPSYTNAPGEDNCTACHTSFPVNSGKGSVSISGIPQSYFPGEQIPITVVTSQAGQTNYGFQLTAIDSAGLTVGTFTLPVENPDRMQTVNNIVGGNIRQYVEHTSDGVIPPGFDSNSWTFTWTAPAGSAGTIGFYAAGNAANSDGSPTGDYIYTTSVLTSPASSASIGGKVLAPDGRGVRNAKVTLTGQNFSVSTTTSSFGLYSFMGIPTGHAYTIRAISKSYRFTSKSVTLNGDLNDVNFAGIE